MELPAMTRFALGGALLAAAGGAAFWPAHRLGCLSAALAIGLLWALGELFALGLERFIGLRYLHRVRRSGGANALLASGIALLVAGLALLAVAHARSRVFETIAVVMVLAGGLMAVVAFLLRLFSVFTTVST